MKNLYYRLKSFLPQWWRSIDPELMWALFGLIICGVFLAFTASPSIAEQRNQPPMALLEKQLIILVPSLFMMMGLSMLSPRHIRRVCFLAFVFFLILMMLTPFIGNHVKGGTRWINIGITIQPSEFMKPAFAVLCAWIFASGKLIKNFYGKTIATGIFITLFILLWAQPDYGMSFVIGCIWGVQLFLTGLPLWAVFGTVAIGIGCGVLGYLIFPHVQNRLMPFLDPTVGDHFQINTSIKAFNNGGWFGLGPGEGIFKNVLPDAHTDFIFAVAAEEFGFILSGFIVFLFAFIVIRGFLIAQREKNLFNMLAVTGLLTSFGVQALINMSSTLGIIPTKGMTLPFISCGGSSLLSLAFTFGIILSLTRQHSSQGVLE